MRVRHFMDELSEFVMIICGILFLVPPFAVTFICHAIANTMVPLQVFNKVYSIPLDIETSLKKRNIQSSLLKVRK